MAETRWREPNADGRLAAMQNGYPAFEGDPMSATLSFLAGLVEELGQRVQELEDRERARAREEEADHA